MIISYFYKNKQNKNHIFLFEKKKVAVVETHQLKASPETEG